MGHAGVKFREGCCHFNLTHPFVGHAGVKFREGSGLAKLTHPFVGHAGVKFRERRMLPFQLDSPFCGQGKI